MIMREDEGRGECENVIEIRIQNKSDEEHSRRVASSIKRIVSVNGKTVYADKMSVKMYSVLDDPIRNLELFLLGQKKTESCSDVGCNTRKERCLLAHIWGKVFGKKL